MKNSQPEETLYEHFTDPLPVLAGVGVLFAGALFYGGYILSENYIISGAFSVVGTVLMMIEFVKDRRRKIVKKLEKQFAEVMQAVLSSVCAGSSIDRAFFEVDGDELAGLSGNRLMMREVKIICHGMRLNYPFDVMLDKFAARSGSSEIRNFANVLSITTAKGGNIPFAIRSSLANLRVKLETEQEIEKTLALPVYNQRIMMFMPFILVRLIKSISPGYMSVMYESNIGKIVVIACSALMVMSWVIGIKVCRIEA